MNSLLNVSDLKVKIEDKNILNGVTLTIKPGQIHVIMGPNGSGKSTLAYTLMGHPKYEVTGGSATLHDKDLVSMPVDVRAKNGLFLAFQYPFEIAGVMLKDFLRQSYNALYAETDKQIGMKAFNQLVQHKLEILKMKPEFIDRMVNVGFSGGEKKRAEVLQLAVLQPKLAILDEIDSGLDVDALRSVCEGLNAVKADDPSVSYLIITHYQRILNYIKPDFVHIMQEGRIVKSGGPELALEVEETGYEE